MRPTWLKPPGAAQADTGSWALAGKTLFLNPSQDQRWQDAALRSLRSLWAFLCYQYALVPSCPLRSARIVVLANSMRASGSDSSAPMPGSEDAESLKRCNNVKAVQASRGSDASELQVSMLEQKQHQPDACLIALAVQSLPLNLPGRAWQGFLPIRAVGWIEGANRLRADVRK